MKSFIALIYSAVVGVSVTLFVGFGLWALFPGPKSPEYPHSNSFSYSDSYDEGLSSEYQATQKEYDSKIEKYEKDRKSYEQNSAAAALVVGALFYAAGVLVIRRSEVLGEGLMLGGVFTSIYALILASISSQRVLVFGSVTTLLVMIIFLAHIKFRTVEPKKHKS